MDFQDLKVSLVHKAPVVMQENRVQLEAQAFRVSQELKVPKVSQVTVVIVVQLVPQDL